MNFKSLCAALALAVATAAPSTAAPVLVNFHEGTTVEFFGLDDALTTPQAASSFEVYGPVGRYRGVSVLGASFNSFTFDSSGKLFEGGFRLDLISAGTSATDPSRGHNLIFVEVDFVALNTAGGGDIFFENSIAIEGVVFVDILSSVGRSGTGTPLEGRYAEIRPVPAVPLPAGGLLLLSGLAGVAALKRRKKRAA